MRVVSLICLMLLTLAGCESLGKVKVDNPVFQEPPPRKTTAASAAEVSGSDVDPFRSPFDESERDHGILQVENVTAGGKPSEDIVDTTVVARVNGRPIFAAEVLTPHAPRLAAIKQQASPAEVQQAMKALIQNDLPGHIDRRVLVDSLMETLKPEQAEALQGHLDQAFEAEVERMKDQLKVNSRHEVELELTKQGTSLEAFRTAFGNQQMARQYLSLKIESKRKWGRPELLQYYRDHIEDFSIAAAVKWRQIVVSRVGPGGEQAALEKMEQVVAALKNNVDFAQVAAEFSDGPSAKNGGDWGDWMQRGSLTDKEIERALFQLPVGYISSPFERDDGYYLVKVTDRREAGYVPFGEVQEEILSKLEEQQRSEAIKKLLADMRSQAEVWTIFDDTQKSQTAAREHRIDLPFR